jgi:hypothetical protein
VQQNSFHFSGDQTKIEPLNIRREKYTLKLAGKCARLPVVHWKNYIVALNRLKSQIPFAVQVNCEGNMI